ncbi:MAG TPA: M48 family metalloprotease, partial [Candidatus Hydrogenedens sp.]|nr:M48 family metalloprotease [Candidatus Hydrogenedens sp.]
MFELVKKNKQRSIILAFILLFFMISLGYIIGDFFYQFYSDLSNSQNTGTKSSVSTSTYTSVQKSNVMSNKPLSTSNQSTKGIYQFIISYGWGPLGAILAFFIWIVEMIFAYFFGENVLLSIGKATRIEKKEDYPQLYNIVEEMTIASSLPKIPDIYIIETPEINAFAAGRSPEHSVVAVTRGLLESLNRDQIQGIIA